MSIFTRKAGSVLLGLAAISSVFGGLSPGVQGAPQDTASVFQVEVKEEDNFLKLQERSRNLEEERHKLNRNYDNEYDPDERDRINTEIKKLDAKWLGLKEEEAFMKVHERSKGKEETLRQQKKDLTEIKRQLSKSPLTPEHKRISLEVSVAFDELVDTYEKTGGTSTDAILDYGRAILALDDALVEKADVDVSGSNLDF